MSGDLVMHPTLFVKLTGAHEPVICPRCGGPITALIPVAFLHNESGQLLIVHKECEPNE